MYDFILASHLPANATRYDVYRSVPDPADSQWMWAIWSAVSFASSISSVLVLLAVLSSPKTRASPFNLYLVALAIPDLVFGLSCAITCALNHSRAAYFSVVMCEWCVSSTARKFQPAAHHR